MEMGKCDSTHFIHASNAILSAGHPHQPQSGTPTFHVSLCRYDEVFVAATLYTPTRDFPEAGRVTVYLNLRVSEGMEAPCRSLSAL